MLVDKGFKWTEVGAIPEEWEVRSIVEIADIDPENLTSKTAPDYVFNYIALEDVDYGTLRSHTEQVYRNAPSRARRIIKEGDILISTVRPNLKSHLLISKKLSNWVCSTGFSVLRCKNMVDSRFLYNHFFAYIINTQIENLITGSNYPAISSKEVKSLLVPIPPIPEQTAIATALSDMDALISKTEQLIEKKKAIKQGAMQELLRPKEGWVKIRLGDAIKVYRGGSPRPIQDYLTSNPDGINWIKIGDTSPKSKYIVSSNEKIISDGAKYSRQVFVGDFLLSNSMSFGRPYILNIDGCIHDGWLVLQDYQQSFDREYLYYFLNSNYVLNQYLSLAAGSSVLNLNKDIVEKVYLEKPSDFNEQIHIAKILTSMDEEISMLEQKFEKLQHLKQGMMQTLLTGKIRLL